MDVDRIELFDLFLETAESAKYNISLSNLVPPKVALPPVLQRLSLTDWGEGDDFGLRALLAEQYHVDEDEVLLTNGCSGANYLVCATLLKRGDRAVVERPYYEPLWRVPAAVGARVSFFDRRFDAAYRIENEELARSVRRGTRLVVLTNLHNPSGVAAGKSELQAVDDAAQWVKAHVLCDEVFRHSGLERKPPSAAALHSDRFLVTASLSKFYGLGGLRVGWIVGPKEVLRRTELVQYHSAIGPARAPMLAAKWVLEHQRLFDDHARRLLATNRKTVERWLRQSDSVRWVPPVGNTAFPRMPVNVDRLADVLRRRHFTIIAPGRLFGGLRHFRLGLGVDPTVMRGGLTRVSRAMNTLRTRT